MGIDKSREKGLRCALCHGTDRLTLMQTLDDDKDAGARSLRREAISD